MCIMSRDMLTCTVFEEFMTQFTALSAAKERPSGSFSRSNEVQGSSWWSGVLHFRELSVVQELKAMTPRLLNLQLFVLLSVAIFSYPLIIDILITSLPLNISFYVDDHPNLALSSPQNHHRWKMEKKKTVSKSLPPIIITWRVPLSSLIVWVRIRSLISHPLPLPLSRHLQIPPAEISSLSLCPRPWSIFCCPEVSPLLPFVRQIQTADPKCKPKYRLGCKTDKHNQSLIPASRSHPSPTLETLALIAHQSLTQTRTGHIYASQDLKSRERPS